MTISQESEVRPLFIIDPSEPETAATVTEELERYRGLMEGDPGMALRSLRRFMGAKTEGEDAIEDEDTTWSTMWTDLVGKYAFDFGFDRVTQDSVNRVPKFKEARRVRDARQLTLLTLEHFLVRVEDYRQLGKTALDAAK